VRRRPREEAKQARNEVYRQHILEAAERVFAERGFEAAKLQEISAQAGLSMGTIYAIFPGKTELFTALLELRGQELLALVRELGDSRAEPRHALDRLIEVYIAYFVQHPAFLRTHLRSGVSWALGPALATGTQVQCWSDIHREQSAIFRRGVDAGVFVEEDPEFLAKLFSVIDQVLLADWVAGGMRASRESLVARLRAQVERTFWQPARAGGRAARA
jgi:AcrR family transcriptional regulator